MSARSQSLTDSVTTAAILVTCGVLVAANWGKFWPPDPTIDLPPEPVSLAEAAVRGDPTVAKVAVIAFSDYQCPFCAQFDRDVFPALDESYVRTGKIVFAHRNLPIDAIHPFARQAAIAAACAGEQGLFWDIHSRLLQGGRNLDAARIAAFAVEAGLDMGAFETCLTTDEAAARVRRDGEAARALGLRGTPSFLIGRLLADGTVQVTSVFRGGKPLEEFAAAIDGALATRSVTSRLLVTATGGLGMMGLLGLRALRRRSLGREDSVTRERMEVRE